MPKTQIKVQQETIEKAQRLLSELPKIEKAPEAYSGQATVKALRGEIKEAQKRGYSIEQIADYLKGVGIAISGPTLKNYLTRAQSKTKVNSVRTSRADTPSARSAHDPHQQKLIDDAPDAAQKEEQNAAMKAKLIVSEDTPNI